MIAIPALKIQEVERHGVHLAKLSMIVQASVDAFSKK